MGKTEKTEKKNGGKRAGAGMPKGYKTKKTLEKAAAREEYRQLVLKRLKPIFEHQYSLVQGISYLYRIDENQRGGKEHVIVTDPNEIGDILAQMHDEGELMPGEYNDKYYYITVRPPENAAIKDMLDRALDKAVQPIAGDKDNPLTVRILSFDELN